MNIWTTADGTEIPIRKLEDSHLLNIERWIKKRAEEGVMIGGGGLDVDDIWYYELFDEEALDYFNYKVIKREIKRRKLTSL